MRRNYNQRSMQSDYSPRGNYSEPPNFGSARSDYGNLAYGGTLNRQGEQRGWADRTTDEISSWFGDEEAERRRQMDERLDERRYGERGYYADERGRGRRRGEPGWHAERARDVMTRGVATVHPDDPVAHAAQMMSDCDCGALPVVDRQGRMIGMITDRDIAVRLVARDINTRDARVGDCMTDDVFACHEDDRLDSCMRSMSHHQIRRMPIVDDRHRVVGIVSQGDLAQHAGEGSRRGERRAVADVVCAVSEPSSGSYR
jgi:CBS domain-containing protein